MRLVTLVGVGLVFRFRARVVYPMVGATDPGQSYGNAAGFVFVFNLVVGVGGLTMPLAFADTGLILGIWTTTDHVRSSTHSVLIDSHTLYRADGIPELHDGDVGH